MALRLFKANNASGPVFAADVTGDDGPFWCGACNVPVIRVTDHLIHGEDLRRRRSIPAFFRLESHGRHATNCPQSIQGAIEAIMRVSDAVEDRIEPEFELNGKIYTFRLNIPTLLANRPQFTAPAEAFGPKLGRILREGHLDSYCRSAVGLAILWNGIEGTDDRNELRENIIISDKNKQIPWSNFSFSPPRYGELFRELSKKYRHSTAVLVTIQEIGDLRREIVRVQCAAVRTNRRGMDFRIAPIMFVRAPIARRLLIDQQYIAFGDWRVGDVNFWAAKDTGYRVTYQDVMLTVERSSQLARLNVPGEDEDV